MVLIHLEVKNNKETAGLFDRIKKKKKIKTNVNKPWKLHSETIIWYSKDCMSNNNPVILSKHIKIQHVISRLCMLSEISKVIKDTVVSIISEPDVKEALCTLEAGQTAQNRVQNLW